MRSTLANKASGRAAVTSSTPRNHGILEKQARPEANRTSASMERMPLQEEATSSENPRPQVDSIRVPSLSTSTPMPFNREDASQAQASWR